MDLMTFNEAEILLPNDLTEIGQTAREAIDAVHAGALGWPSHWARITVAKQSSDVVTISPGEYHSGAFVFTNRETISLNFQTYKPTTSADERWLALILRGSEITVNATRAIETSDEPLAESLPVNQAVPKRTERRMSVVVQSGSIVPPPAAKPSVNEDDCCIAFVRLTTSGIQEVISGSAWRVKTVFEIDARVMVLETLMQEAFQRVTNLETDFANLQSRFSLIPRPEVIRQLQRDVARTRRILNLPDEARGYFYDAGLVKDQWALDHGLWLARVDEGIRFPWAAERDERLEVLHPDAADITIFDDILMPKWTEAVKLEVDGAGGYRNISQQVHSETVGVEYSTSRSAISYGPTVAMCDNYQEWAQIGSAREGQVFEANGEKFEKIGTIDASYAGANLDVSVFNKTHGVNYGTNDLIIHNATAAQLGNRLVYAARSVQVDTWTETYWDYVTVTYGVNGSVYGQTFLQTQPMILTGVGVFFTRVANEGNVTLMLVEVSDVGTPRFDKVIARSVLTPADISMGWTKFPFRPRYVAPGRRYAWVTVTTGNHALKTVSGNAFTQGTLFWSTDQAWFQGSPEEDFAFRLHGCEFARTRAVVEFDMLTLDNGMTEIKLLYEGWAPDGTSMMWEVRPSGQDEWKPLRPETDDAPNPLRGLPASTRLRLTMQGTSGLAPAIVLNSRARGMTRRPRGDARAVSKILNFGFSTTAIVVEATMDQFDDDKHQVAPKLVIGSTSYDADTVSISNDLSKITRRLVKATFAVPATSSARLRIDMETDNVQFVPFVENCSLFAL